MGYASKGSTASLAGGVGTGFVLILAGYLSLQAFHKRKNSYFALILETGITLSYPYIKLHFILVNLGSLLLYCAGIVLNHSS